MNTIKSVVLSIIVVLTSTGCAVQTGYADNSFGARAARGVKAAMSHDLCPNGVKDERIQVRSEVQISSDSRARYREDTVQVEERYQGRKTAECNPSAKK